MKSAFDGGLIIPVYVDEALPGDSFNLRMTAFARLATPIKPVMDNMFLDSFFFAVPIRLIWSNFQKFMGEQANPGDSTTYLVPRVQAPAVTGAVTNSLSDYMGLPVGVPSIYFDSLWHRAYNLIWNEWFRDQNLQNSVTVPLGDGPDTYTDFAILRRGKRHDYFTSCLPWPQKGADVPIPIGSTAPVKGIGSRNTTWVAGNVTVYENGIPAGTTYTNYKDIDPAAANTLFTVERNSGTSTPHIWADLSQATAATVNSLRQAFQLQKLYERDARGGTRYIEIVKSHFLVDSPDLRAVRPIYLGGGSSPVNLHPVAQTAPAAAGTTPQGNLAGFGTVGVHGHGFSKSFTEHCVILGLVSVRADLTYQQGLDRMFSRRTRFDFFWPSPVSYTHLTLPTSDLV